MARNNQSRQFKGFVALEREGGPILWGTMRADAAETRRLFLHWNPMQTPLIVPIRLSLEAHNLTNGEDSR